MQIEDIANQSLDLIGYKRHIGHIYEGTPAAKMALGYWAETRDELLSKLQPDWSKKHEVLALLKEAPTQYDPTTPWTQAYPPLPWRYEYAYPADCVTDLQIHSTPNTFPIWRPRYAPYRLGYDAGAMCVLTNEANAILTYVGKAFDTNLWHSEFTAVFIEGLAKKMASLMPHAAAAEEKKDGGNPAR